MDPLTAPIVLAGLKKALDSASGEAGRQAWEGFVALARRAFGRPDAVVAREQPEALAGSVAEAAEHDPALAADLRTWLAQASQLEVHNHSVSNTISGNATIGGNVVQARDIGGSITFN
jgi:hypothetical protein